MRVLVCGGREFSDLKLFTDTMTRIDGDDFVIDMVIHGGARGADSMASSWARYRGREEVVCPANWDALGKRAGVVRNNTMLKLRPDLVVAFPGGKGTAHMVMLAEAAGLPVTKITETGDGQIWQPPA
jgi:hypothetical protein